MTPEERAALRAALERMLEADLIPYRLVGDSLGRAIDAQAAERAQWSEFLPGHSGPTATTEIEPPPWGALSITYGPDPEGAAHTGEIVRTWVPRDAGSRGAYGPVLIVGDAGDDRMLAVRMSRIPHDGRRPLFPIGAGPRDSHGRLSWVDMEHIFSVHRDGMRRSGFVMDRPHFIRVADELYGRYGWPMED